MIALSPFAFPSISVPSGGGGGGAELNPLDFMSVNPASGFTNLTPDAMAFKSIVTDAGTGVTTYTFDALTSGTSSAGQKYNFTGADSGWPRRYQLLKDSAGTTLTTDDSFVMVVKMSLYDATVPSSADLRFGVGLCIDPTSQTVAAFDGYGITLRTRSASRVGGVVKFDATGGSASNYSNASTTTVYGYIIRSKRRLSGLIAQGEPSSGDTPSNSMVDNSSTTELAASTNLSLWVGVGLQLSTGGITDGQSFAVKTEYQIIRTR